MLPRVAMQPQQQMHAKINAEIVVRYNHI